MKQALPTSCNCPLLTVRSYELVLQQISTSTTFIEGVDDDLSRAEMQIRTALRGTCSGMDLAVVSGTSCQICLLPEHVVVPSKLLLRRYGGGMVAAKRNLFCQADARASLVLRLQDRRVKRVVDFRSVCPKSCRARRRLHSPYPEAKAMPL